MALRDFEPPAVRPSPWWRSRRWIGGLAVVVVHIGFISAILMSLPVTRALLPVPHEMYFLFPRAKPVHLPVRTEPSAAQAHAAGPLFRYPPATAITLPPPPSATTNGLDVALFGCRPENVANLSPAERAQCGDAFASYAYRASLPGTVQIQALQAARWRSAIAARNAPLAVPCTGVEPAQGAAPGKSATALMVDPICLLHVVTADGGR